MRLVPALTRSDTAQSNSNESNSKQAKEGKKKKKQHTQTTAYRGGGTSGVPLTQEMELVSTRRHPPKNHKNASSPFDVFLWWDTNPDGNNRPLWTIKKSNFSVTTPKAQRGRAFVNKLFPRVDEAASAGSLRLSRITRGNHRTPASYRSARYHSLLISTRFQ